jgi:large subunit ribosomal protein L4
VAVIQGFDFEAPRTRELTELLGKLDQPGKILFLTHGVNRELYLSGRNLPGVRVLPFGAESPYDVVWSGTLVIEEAALEGLPDAPGHQDERARRRPLEREAAIAPETDGEDA